MAHFVTHEPCPACGSRDNLGRYSDGSAWCFGCHYVERRSHIDRPQPLSNLSNLNHDTSNIPLPDDLSFDYPGHVVSWLAKYGISVEEGIKHGWKYSPKWDQLTFIFLDGDGSVACTQARNFRAGKRKYYNQGSPKDVLPIFHGPAGTKLERSLVVVEDAVSAAKISRQCDAMPCLGSYLPTRKIMALKPFYEVLYIWLDSDKLKEAREIETMAKWVGFSAKTIYTELDPKEYSDEEIRQFLS